VSSIESLLITGGSGFVGQSLLDHLATVPKKCLPHEIAVTAYNKNVKIPTQLREIIKVTEILSDLSKPWKIDFRATHIVHLAADGSENAYASKAAKNFELMTQNLVSWCEGQESPVVFHASSGACFGHIPLIEGEGVDNLSKNSSRTQIALVSKKKKFIKSRLEAETILEKSSLEGVIDLRIGRLFSFIGNHLRNKPHYAVSSFVHMAETTKKIEITGNPSTTRSYLSAADMSSWIYKALQSGISNEVLSIGSSIPVTIFELASFIAKNSNSRVALLNPLAEGDYYVANNLSTCERLQEFETEPWQTSIMKYMGIN